MMNKKLTVTFYAYNWVGSILRVKEKRPIRLATPFMTSFYSVGIRDLPALALTKVMHRAYQFSQPQDMERFP